MFEFVGGMAFDVHGISGLIAILLMFVHAVWALMVLIKGDEVALRTFHRFSVFVWVVRATCTPRRLSPRRRAARRNDGPSRRVPGGAVAVRRGVRRAACPQPTRPGLDFGVGLTLTRLIDAARRGTSAAPDVDDDPRRDRQ